MSPINVAVIGATGNIGFPIAQGLLSSNVYPQKIAKVVVITRDTTSDKVKALIALGAEAVRVKDGDISSQLFQGIDVVVNALAGPAGPAIHDAYAKAAAEAGAKVYFTADFGGDYALWNVQHVALQGKQARADYARQVGQGRMKVISVFPGAFLDMVFHPYCGIDLKQNTVTAWGDPKTRFSTTALKDIASSVVQLAILAAANPESVPDRVRLSGDAVSYQQVADLFSKESGKAVEVGGKAEDYDRIKAEFDKEHQGKTNLYGYFRLWMCSGAFDYSKNNHNELVNPGQTLWKWKSVEDVAKETKGKGLDATF